MSSQKKKGMNLERKQNFTGWVFLLPATILIAWMSFYPMIQAFILSLQTGMGINLKFNGFANYARILKDPTFKQTLSNTFLYLIIQVPIMLILGLMFASMLNNKDLRFKGLFRTCIFLPCATSLVILRNDFPFPVCKRWIYQHRSAWTWHASDHVVLQCLDSPCRYHHRIGLEMDGIQYGILPLRYAEH